MNTMFVYGLLKPGLSLHHVAEPYVTRAVPARARGRLYDAGVPAARFDEDGEIEGFVFFIDEVRLDEALRELDDLEDEGTEYRRIVVSLATEDGPVEAYAYHYLLEVAPEAYVGTAWVS
jgi:gamma-glutamylcyclotransferase (GGCT)/AIG2-like uncharacterized protein YtfP